MKRILVIPAVVTAISTSAFAQDSDYEAVCKAESQDSAKLCQQTFLQTNKDIKQLPLWDRFLAKRTAVKDLQSCKREVKSVFEDCLENPPTDLNLISVDTPIPGATTSERGITISGSIENYQPTQTLSVNGFGAVIDASGDFTLTPFPLEVGNNSLEFLLFETGQSVAVESETLNLNYTPINEAVEPFTVAAGGTVTVDDTNSEIFGASFTVGPNSIRRDFLAYIEHDPEHVPNLPIEFTQVGEPLTLYPIAEGFSNPGVLSVPYDTSLLPDNTTTSGVFILALSDDGWVALDSFQGNFNTVSAEIDGSTYGAFIGVVETVLSGYFP